MERDGGQQERAGQACLRSAQPFKHTRHELQTEDGLLHVAWFERAEAGAAAAAAPENDTIVFPGEAAFEKARAVVLLR